MLGICKLKKKKCLNHWEIFSLSAMQSPNTCQKSYVIFSFQATTEAHYNTLMTYYSKLKIRWNVYIRHYALYPLLNQKMKLVSKKIFTLPWMMILIRRLHYPSYLSWRMKFID